MRKKAYIKEYGKSKIIHLKLIIRKFCTIKFDVEIILNGKSLCKIQVSSIRE